MRGTQNALAMIARSIDVCATTEYHVPTLATVCKRPHVSTGGTLLLLVSQTQTQTLNRLRYGLDTHRRADSQHMHFQVLIHFQLQARLTGSCDIPRA